MDSEPRLYHNDRYEDVTSDFKEYASKMKVGELAHVPDFKLFDAINAFEMGSARMDTGLKFRPLQDDLKAIPKVSSAQDVCDLADILVAEEMAWHQGNMPLRTIFCCLPFEEVVTNVTELSLDNFTLVKDESKPLLKYLESLLVVSSWHDVARIYILATIKVSSMTMAFIENEPVIIPLDEDFHIAHGNYYMLENTPLDLVLRLLDAALRFSKTEKSVVRRLQLKASWLQVIKQKFAKKPVHVDNVIQALTVYDDYDFDRENPMRVTLSDGVQSRATNFSLAQPLVVIPLKDAVEQWRKIAASLKDLARVTSITRSADLMGFFLVFSSEGHLPIVRASLKQVIALSDILGQSVRTWIVKDIRELSCPDWDPHKSRSLYEPYITQASQCYMELITTFLHTRPLQREGLFGLVSLYDSLQVTADQIDEAASQQGLGRKLHTGSNQKIWALELSSAVQLRKLQVMLWLVLYTVELEIALPWEYPYVFWYAAQLCQHLIDQLGRLKAYFEQHNMRSTQEGYSYLVALELEARGLSQVCSAQYLIHVALDKLGMIKKPKAILTPDLSLQYGLRFQVFESVGVPPMATLDDFNTVYEKLTPEIALEAGRNSLSGAVSLLKTLTRVTQENTEMALIVRSCVGLQVAITQIEKSNAQAALNYERSGYHRYFPVVSPIKDSAN
ncbi:N-alpha-acetyltransferase 35, NatC auxiliary subunit [Wickerhamiella sorbophila]|uniref:N-alpha-acetyltransferase 35, NatC auxiliary subunit n=1 Tax=Wickerhamiella sorbophila TaxID=45607 RepID=A0A2T0FND8_9ASCO|nr:N-alpha-acetyltransferase 35, NatC auxiliary subunit [Wickerhamiella sorbophila]PRT56485.1 N-alpha-acetyltransferase 35, NatC auxiliary subunit [Wickerhamiella sorbophila]